MGAVARAIAAHSMPKKAPALPQGLLRSTDGENLLKSLELR